MKDQKAKEPANTDEVSHAMKKLESEGVGKEEEPEYFRTFLRSLIIQINCLRKGKSGVCSRLLHNSLLVSIMAGNVLLCYKKNWRYKGNQDKSVHT